MPRVAVIDIGSNSIKVLVVARDGAGPAWVLQSKTIDARISAGIGGSAPRLSPEGMARGLAAITELLGDATTFAPAAVVLVATSAVRDAVNGAEFRALVRAATGHEIRILTGAEEAALIGRGLTCDPALADLRDFYVFDLGGGSLECLAFCNRRIQQAVSLQLGCVRLTEKFVADPSAPFSAEARQRIDAHVRDVLRQSGFRFTLTAAAGVGTGGTVATVRAILGARTGRPVEAADPRVTLALLRELLDQTGALPLAQRCLVPGLPPSRADVFPAALATIIALADVGGLGEFRHSFYNLRWGLAAETLDHLPGGAGA